LVLHLEKKLPLFKVIVNINNKILWVEMFESLTTMLRRQGRQLEKYFRAIVYNKFF
jgi:hypothetical protein